MRTQAAHSLSRCGRTLLCLLGLAACGPATQAADAQTRLGGDVFIAGGTLTVSEPVDGDLFAAGGSLDVDAPVAGDALAVGGKVRFGADIGQSVYSAGGQLSINSRVGHNLRVAAGHIHIGPKAEVAGNVSMAGGQVRLDGAVRGHVQAAGGQLWIDGPVGGNVVATSGRVQLGPHARIAGKLSVHAGDDALQLDPAAQVGGGIERLWRKPERAASAPADSARGPAFNVSWWWALGLAVMAAVLLAALPGLTARVAHSWSERFGLSVLLGFVWLVCAPVAVLVLLVTIVGIPLALLGGALYVVLLPLGYVSTAIALGDWVLRRLRADAAALWGWRLLACTVALLVMAMLAQVPWLGGLLAFVALLAGLGALALQVRRPAAAAQP